MRLLLGYLILFADYLSDYFRVIWDYLWTIYLIFSGIWNSGSFPGILFRSHRSLEFCFDHSLEFSFVPTYLEFCFVPTISWYYRQRYLSLCRCLVLSTSMWTRHLGMGSLPFGWSWTLHGTLKSRACLGGDPDVMDSVTVPFCSEANSVMELKCWLYNRWQILLRQSGRTFSRECLLTLPLAASSNCWVLGPGEDIWLKDCLRYCRLPIDTFEKLLEVHGEMRLEPGRAKVLAGAWAWGYCMDAMGAGCRITDENLWVCLHGSESAQTRTAAISTRHWQSVGSGTACMRLCPTSCLPLAASLCQAVKMLSNTIHSLHAARGATRRWTGSKGPQ